MMVPNPTAAGARFEPLEQVKVPGLQDLVTAWKAEFLVVVQQI